MGTSLLLKISFLAAILTSTVNANQAGKKRLRKGNETKNNSGEVLPEIVGGLAAPKGFFSHQVSFVKGDGNHYCGGSLIANNVVLGAAHCVHYFGSEEVMQNRAVHVNKYYGKRKNWNMEVLKICDIAVHPKWNKTVKYDYDFVLKQAVRELISR
jgi:hypothetical protein